MKAILYKRGKSAMQSGIINAEMWIVRPFAEEKLHFRFTPPNWFGAHSTIGQQCMEFSSKEKAVAFCKQHEISYHEVPTYTKKLQPKSYTQTITKP